MRMTKKINLFLFSFLIVFVFFSFPAFADGISTQKHVLENGLTVLISEMPLSSSVSVYGLIKTGSANEGMYLGAGLSHFMEHMIFKGTQRRGVGEGRFKGIHEHAAVHVGGNDLVHHVKNGGRQIDMRDQLICRSPHA